MPDLVTRISEGFIAIATELRRQGDLNLPVQVTQVVDDNTYYLRNQIGGATYVVTRRALSTGLKNGRFTGNAPAPEDLSTLTYT